MIHQQWDFSPDEEVYFDIIEERNREIRAIEHDMEQIVEIQMDLSHLIHEQGDDIVIVERHIENSAVNVVEATKNLEIAEIKTNGGRKIFIGGLITAACITAGGAALIPASIIAGGVVMGCGIATGATFIIARLASK